MNVKKFSQLTGLSTHTLRYYEKIGLIEVPRDSNGHRIFAEEDAKWVACLQRLKATSMPLKDIKSFAAMRHNGSDHRLRILEAHQARLNEKREAVVKSLERVEAEINLFKNWNNLL